MFLVFPVCPCSCYHDYSAYACSCHYVSFPLLFCSCFFCLFLFFLYLLIAFLLALLLLLLRLLLLFLVFRF